MKLSYCLIVWLFLGLLSGAQSSSDHDEFGFVRQQIKGSHGFIPRNGFVPDKDAAIAIAYAVAVPAYGKKEVDAEKPLRAELEDGRWTVLGTLQRGATSGGTLIVQIDQGSGEICYLSHSM